MHNILIETRHSLQLSALYTEFKVSDTRYNLGINATPKHEYPSCAEHISGH